MAHLRANSTASSVSRVLPSNTLLLVHSLRSVRCRQNSTRLLSTRAKLQPNRISQERFERFSNYSEFFDESVWVSGASDDLPRPFPSLIRVCLCTVVPLPSPSYALYVIGPFFFFFFFVSCLCCFGHLPVLPVFPSLPRLSSPVHISFLLYPPFLFCYVILPLRPCIPTARTHNLPSPWWARTSAPFCASASFRASRYLASSVFSSLPLTIATTVCHCVSSYATVPVHTAGNAPEFPQREEVLPSLVRTADIRQPRRLA